MIVCVCVCVSSINSQNLVQSHSQNNRVLSSCCNSKWFLSVVCAALCVYSVGRPSAAVLCDVAKHNGMY